MLDWAEDRDLEDDETAAITELREELDEDDIATSLEEELDDIATILDEDDTLRDDDMALMDELPVDAGDPQKKARTRAKNPGRALLDEEDAEDVRDELEEDAMATTREEDELVIDETRDEEEDEELLASGAEPRSRMCRRRRYAE